jgi:hypothetical protein
VPEQYPTDMTTIWKLTYMCKKVFLFNKIINFDKQLCFDWVKIVKVPSGRKVLGVGLQRPVFWDYRFEFRRGHGCLSLESDVCCQVDVSETGWLLVQRIPIEFGVSECDREASKMAMEKKIKCL